LSVVVAGSAAIAAKGDEDGDRQVWWRETVVAGAGFEIVLESAVSVES
jgi:hypothetical protein